MISLLTSSKTMDFDSPAQYDVDLSELLFPAQTKQIQATLAKYDAKQMAKLMHVSQKLSEHVVDLYSHPSGRRKAAIYAYRGDVYRGLNADSLSRPDVEWANDHILIPSGLYGLVRPFDGIEQYRLEMKTKLKVGDKTSLYDFWGNDLAKYIESIDSVVLVLASSEYAKAITSRLGSDMRIVDVVFRDKSARGAMKTVPIYSKIMRGVMANHIIKNRIDSPEGLIEFSQYGYEYDATASSESALVFSRNKSYPIRA